MLTALYALQECALINRALGSSLAPGDLDTWPAELIDVALAWAGEAGRG